MKNISRHNSPAPGHTDSSESTGSNRTRLIAAGITFLFALLLFLFLFFGSIGFDHARMAEASIPEIGEEEEELFLDPMLIDPGEDQSPVEQTAAPEAQGSPEVKDQPDETARPIVKDDNPKPAPPKEKLVSQKEESPVKTTTPSATEKEKRNAEAKVANAFKDPGKQNGKNNASGSGGAGVGVSGNANGWKFLGCPSPKVTLSSKKTVTVAVTVNAQGVVTSARATGGDPALHDACERAARQARWQPLHNSEGKTARGTITFTITPR